MVEKEDVKFLLEETISGYHNTAEHFWLRVSGIPGIQQDALTPSGWT